MGVIVLGLPPQALCGRRSAAWKTDGELICREAMIPYSREYFAALQRLPFTKDEIVAACTRPSSRKSRLIRRGLITCGWLIAVVMVYVASIGPLAWLDSRGFGSDETWKHLHKTAYRPIFHAWWYGPSWIGNSLGWYTELFAGSSGRGWKGGRPPYFTKRYNDLCRNVRIWPRSTSGELTEEQAYDPQTKETGVFGWDVLLMEHAEREFQ